MLVRADPRAGDDLDALVPARPARHDSPGARAIRRARPRSTRPTPTAASRARSRPSSKLTGVPINYYVTVDFRGFIDTVDELDGIFMDIDRRYFNDNSNCGENYSAIDLRARLPAAQRPPRALVRPLPPHGQRLLPKRAPAAVHQGPEAAAVARSSISKLGGVVTTIEPEHRSAGGGSRVDLRHADEVSRRLAYDLPTGNLFQPRLENLESNAYFQLTPPEGEIDRAVQEFLNPDTDAGKKATRSAVGREAGQDEDRGAARFAGDRRDPERERRRGRPPTTPRTSWASAATRRSPAATRRRRTTSRRRSSTTPRRRARGRGPRCSRRSSTRRRSPRRACRSRSRRWCA